VRDTLKAATHDVHRRLHRHAGFAALQDGTIEVAGYRALLARLYGFHLPFEPVVQIEPRRSRSLEADLRTLGVSPYDLRNLPLCRDLPHLDTEGRRMGALYVLKGSALGGRVLARQLDRLFGVNVPAGRTFLLGGAFAESSDWIQFLSELERTGDRHLPSAELVGGACETFLALETWLKDWEPAQ
jgi:heme oxygenase